LTVTAAAPLYLLYLLVNREQLITAVSEAGENLVGHLGQSDGAASRLAVAVLGEMIALRVRTSMSIASA
jgi:hypothetical protein